MATQHTDIVAVTLSGLSVQPLYLLQSISLSSLSLGLDSGKSVGRVCSSLVNWKMYSTPLPSRPSIPHIAHTVGSDQPVQTPSIFSLEDIYSTLALSDTPVGL